MPDETRRQLRDGVVNQLAGAGTEEEMIVGPGGLLAQLTRRLVEGGLEVELTGQVAYERHLKPPGGTGTSATGRRQDAAD